jgi:hypothetical protein
MAYADKITTMRRMALIHPGHNIAYEGVDIEGACVLKEYGSYGTAILLLHDIEVAHFAESNGLEVKYQDPENEPAWEPRADTKGESTQ